MSQWIVRPGKGAVNVNIYCCAAITLGVDAISSMTLLRDSENSADGGRTILNSACGKAPGIPNRSFAALRMITKLTYRQGALGSAGL